MAQTAFGHLRPAQRRDVDDPVGLDARADELGGEAQKLRPVLGDRGRAQRLQPAVLGQRIRLRERPCEPVEIGREALRKASPPRV